LFRFGTIPYSRALRVGRISTVHKPLSFTARFAMRLVLAGAAVTLAPRLVDVPSDRPSTASTEPAEHAAQQSPPSLVPAAAAAATRRPNMVIESQLALNRPMGHGDYTWADEGVPAGPTWIHVDLASETIRVVRGTSEIGRAMILYGADDKPTPSGQFKITQKKRHHVSNLYNREMPYMLRLTNDGIAIHGSVVEYGYATHGCIGVPEEFAALLFREADLGDRVIITGVKS
jgi:lipoprotein-anchoring transpeptidase ErfK/SrfK